MADLIDFEVDGLVKQKEQLDSLLTNNPEMERKIQGIVRQAILRARREVSAVAKDSMKTSRREAYRPSNRQCISE